MIKKTKGKEIKEKTFNVEYCPKCKSFDVAIALGAKLGTWECKKCKYKGTGFPKKEMNEDEYFEYLDKQGVEMPELGEPQTVKGVDDKSQGEKKSYKDILRERLARGEKI
jgi:ribosomal protein L37AE/L43A